MYYKFIMSCNCVELFVCVHACMCGVFVHVFCLPCLLSVNDKSSMIQNFRGFSMKHESFPY